MPCPFCKIDPARIVWSSPLVVAIRDGYPVSDGHTLVVPRRHVGEWFGASREEQHEILRAIDEIKAALDYELQPDGYNIGVNSGAAAGQTVMHLHAHLIPRYTGDVDDPSGGVRFVIPARGNYHEPGRIPRPGKPKSEWTSGHSPTPRLVKGGEDDPFVRHIRPVLQQAEQADIVAAFVQGSGVELLASSIATAIDRGTRIRVITGDYLHITQSQALRRLLDWSQIANSSESPDHGSFDIRVIETKTLGGRSFHPKCWRIATPTDGIAWVGSSNWSHMALTRGVEWNLRLQRTSDPDAYAEIEAAFDALWAKATVLTGSWLDSYTDRADQARQPLPIGDGEDIQPAETFGPIGVQSDALAALAQSRAEGRKRALIVLATGLGKTFLAAFDVQAMAKELGRQPRVLFIAHRRELMLQAATTFRKVFPRASLGFFVGQSDTLDADLVFASVQKLTLDHNWAKLSEHTFDYVIVDESHHAPAQSYRKVLRQLDPAFLLGLTATPDRADQSDVAGLFDDHIAYRADLGAGIDIGRLVPFDYAGLPDTIEFENIPWRRYTIDQLSSLAETEARMSQLWRAWSKYPGTRTLVFCVSINHANYVRDWLTDQGIRIAAVHTGQGSADRDTALEDIEAGRLDALASVDLFNEGIDLPLIDRVVMLRPTASPVVFLQQLGRGLRVAPGKARLQVVDFIGNHKVFLGKVATLLSLSKEKISVGDFLTARNDDLMLASGCRANIDLEVIDILEKFLPQGGDNQTIRIYRELRDAREQRPTAGELLRMGMNPRSLRKAFGNWFAFVQKEGDLSREEDAAFTSQPTWFAHLEKTAMTKSFKMVTLNILIEADALFDGLFLDELAARAHDALDRDPSLGQDIVGVQAFTAGRTSAAWKSYWRRNPVKAWCNSPWFSIHDDRLVFGVTVPPTATAQAFATLTQEIVDLRLAAYRRRIPTDSQDASSFVCKVWHNSQQPILKLPDANRADLPQGETDVRLDDGRIWQFRFMKIACNVARPVGSQKNQLPDLLRRWFGPAAGLSGTSFQVRFRRSPDGWYAEPFGVVIEPSPLGFVVSYPTLRAAAGAASDAQIQVEAATVRLPNTGPDQFAVRASGDSMEGGKRPIRDGDWVVLSWARSLGLPAVNGKICLVARGPADAGRTHHLKRVVTTKDGIKLRSENPDAPDLAITDDTVVIARLADVVRPESLAPLVGAVMTDLIDAFDLTEPPTPGISRVDGHLFLLVDGAESLDQPDRLRWSVHDRVPAETAFVLTRSGDAWRYAGVGRWRDDAWCFPAGDFGTWRALGHGRSASHRLAPLWSEGAQRLADFIETHHGVGDAIEGRGKTCQFQGRASRGGVRIDGEQLAERTVSLTDLGWVLAAYSDVNIAKNQAAILDEAWVNKLRYLDGTPKASTRWIDTGWALVLLDHATGMGFSAATKLD